MASGASAVLGRRAAPPRHRRCRRQVQSLVVSSPRRSRGSHPPSCREVSRSSPRLPSALQPTEALRAGWKRASGTTALPPPYQSGNGEGLVVDINGREENSVGFRRPATEAEKAGHFNELGRTPPCHELRSNRRDAGRVATRHQPTLRTLLGRPSTPRLPRPPLSPPARVPDRQHRAATTSLDPAELGPAMGPSPERQGGRRRAPHVELSDPKTVDRDSPASERSEPG